MKQDCQSRRRNAPYVLGARSVAFALATGNTTVLKGSELSPRVFWAIGDIFRQAGLPDGCLNVIYHRPTDAGAITETLIAHPAIKKINFTGSTLVGSIIASLAGKHVKPLLLELGGKASAIVLKDADLNKAAAGCVMGAFIHVCSIFPDHFQCQCVLSCSQSAGNRVARCACRRSASWCTNRSRKILAQLSRR